MNIQEPWRPFAEIRPLCVPFWKFSQVTGSPAVTCARQGTDVCVVRGTAARQFWIQMRAPQHCAWKPGHSGVTRCKPAEVHCAFCRCWWTPRPLHCFLNPSHCSIILLADAPAMGPAEWREGAIPSDSSDPFLEGQSASDSSAVLPCVRSPASASSFCRQHSAPIPPFNELRTVSNRQVKACPAAGITCDPFLPMP